LILSILVKAHNAWVVQVFQAFDFSLKALDNTVAKPFCLGNGLDSPLCALSPVLCSANSAIGTLADLLFQIIGVSDTFRPFDDESSVTHAVVANATSALTALVVAVGTC
jgi:hypothetical protein